MLAIRDILMGWIDFLSEERREEKKEKHWQYIFEHRYLLKIFKILANQSVP